MALFADIILPLPLPGMFTYAIPPTLERQVTARVRVLVPFGKNKTHVGIVSCLHHTPPEGYEVKDILQVLDATPILLDSQLKLWQWIADYYMSPIGEVYKAALP
jgi:primosomal protein N' (replication factor Y)